MIKVSIENQLNNEFKTWEKRFFSIFFWKCDPIESMIRTAKCIDYHCLCDFLKSFCLKISWKCVRFFLKKKAARFACYFASYVLLQRWFFQRLNQPFSTWFSNFIIVILFNLWFCFYFHITYALNEYFFLFCFHELIFVTHYLLLG